MKIEEELDIFAHQVFITLLKKPYNRKPKRSEVGLIQNNFKYMKLHSDQDSQISVLEFKNALLSGFPHKCTSWTESTDIKDEIHNFKSNVMCFDFDKEVRNHIAFEWEANQHFHVVQRSASWGKEENGKPVFKYHCYLILDEVITDIVQYDLVYKEYVHHFSDVFQLPLDMSIHSTKIIFAGQKEALSVNPLPLASLLEVEPDQEEVPADIPRITYSSLNFDLFKQIIKQLTDKELFVEYDDWLKICFALQDMVEQQKMTNDQLQEIADIIDDGSGATDDLLKYIKGRKTQKKHKRITTGYIWRLFRDQHIEEEKIREAFGYKPVTYDEENKKIPSPFNVKKGKLYKTILTNDGEEEKEISRFAPTIRKEFTHIERNQIHYEITWKNRERIQKEIVPANVLATKRDLLTLAEKGFSVNDLNYKTLIQYFDRYLDVNTIEQSYMTDRLGYVNGGPFIHPLASNGIEIVPVDVGEKQLLEAFQTAGTVESWREKIFDLIKTHPIALFYTIASFASILLHDLNIDPFIVETAGGTSQGKTTGMHVARSVFGTEGLINQWDTTRVSVERKAGFLNSFPLFMDDTRKANERILQSVIYSFSGGRGKGRGSVRGSQREVTWRNILFSTGEIAITEYAKNAGGAAARVISMTSSPFQNGTADFFNELYASLKENYGAVGLAFIQEWEARKDELMTEFHQYRNFYLERAKGNDVLTRLSLYYSVVHFAGVLLQTFFNFTFNLQTFVRLFDQMAEENKAIDKPMEKLEELLQELNANRKYLAGRYAPEKVWGIYKDETIWFTPTFLKEFLGTEESMMRKEWLKRGMTVGHTHGDKEIDYKLISAGGRKYRGIKVNKKVFDLFDLDFEEMSLEQMNAMES